MVGLEYFYVRLPRGPSGLHLYVCRQCSVYQPVLTASVYMCLKRSRHYSPISKSGSENVPDVLVWISVTANMCSELLLCNSPSPPLYVLAALPLGSLVLLSMQWYPNLGCQSPFMCAQPWHTSHSLTYQA